MEQETVKLYINIYIQCIKNRTRFLHDVIVSTYLPGVVWCKIYPRQRLLLLLTMSALDPIDLELALPYSL